MVVTSQPLAALAGVDMLRQGGNAIDAAVAAAAMLNVLEPMSTGIGGDAFAIIFEAESGKVLGLNASGRSASNATLDEYRSRLGPEAKDIPATDMLAVTVPGTVDGWAQALQRCGRLPLSKVLGPAIAVATEGFAVAPQTPPFWTMGEKLLSRHPDSSSAWLLPGGRAPRAGELFKAPQLAETLRLIAEGGRDVFYRGRIAEEIVRFSEENEGLLTLADFADHTSNWVEPVSINYRGYDVLELPPNGQGVVTLEALNIIGQENLSALGHNTADSIHLQIEAVKLALCDARRYVTDPEFHSIPVDRLISEEYATRQRSRISMERALLEPSSEAAADGDTVYVCAADKDGNVVSWINSIFTPWGSGLTAGDTGIILQNRGSGFSLDPDHVNCIAPRKRTRHTIIPAMMLYEGKPLMAFGCVGGDMQAQAQVQFICNVVDFGMNLQDALDAPRWRYEGVATSIALEDAISDGVRRDLSRRGHENTGSGGFFGGGQALLIHPEYLTFQGGSDPRRDGCAIGY
jgi:gamma-glutamyltranspeptidase/glutathione hydrolase